ncbi:MAG: metallophosphoesterase [Patescibacteria group bacterium]
MRRWIISLFLVLLAGLAVYGWLYRHQVATITRSIRQAVQPPPSVRFAVVGDNHGVNPVYRQIISDIRVQPYAFLLNLADTSERGETAEFRAVKELEAALPFPVYHTVGSHDIKTDPARGSFIQAFGHDRWYAVDVNQVRLIILDNADRKVGFPAAELDWLERDLAAHADRVNLIAYHRPFGLPLAGVLGDDETPASRLTNARLTDIIRRFRVSEIFTAHLHTYLPYTLAGVPAVVSGGGGDPAQFVLGGPTNNYFHYLDVAVSGPTVTIRPVRVTLDTATPAE